MKIELDLIQDLSRKHGNKYSVLTYFYFHKLQRFRCCSFDIAVHPSCSSLTEELACRAARSPWQCIDCKTCNVCDDSGHAVSFQNLLQLHNMLSLLIYCITFYNSSDTKLLCSQYAGGCSCAVVLPVPQNVTYVKILAVKIHRLQ